MGLTVGSLFYAIYSFIIHLDVAQATSTVSLCIATARRIVPTDAKFTMSLFGGTHGLDSDSSPPLPPPLPTPDMWEWGPVSS